MHLIGLNTIQPLSTNVKNSISNSINAKSTADGLQNESSCKEKNRQMAVRVEDTWNRTSNHTKTLYQHFIKKNKEIFKKCTNLHVWF